MPRRWPTKPPQIGTIGEVIRQQLSMTIYCEHRGCGHHAIVDLEGIQAEHGDDFRVSGFVARSRCSICGARHPVGRHQSLAEQRAEDNHTPSV